jgi:hypothetical protein
VRFQKFIDKNFVQYLSPIDFLNSTIMEITFPALSFDSTEQTLKRGKKVTWKDVKNVRDNFTSELDITMRSVDSNYNYFMMLRIMTNFHEDVKLHQIPDFLLKVLDYDGSLLYTVVFREVLLKSLSELRLGYNSTDFSNKTFSMTFRYNFIDIFDELDDELNETSNDIFNLPDYPERSGRDTEINGKLIQP